MTARELILGVHARRCLPRVVPCIVLIAATIALQGCGLVGVAAIAAVTGVVGTSGGGGGGGGNGGTTSVLEPPSPPAPPSPPTPPSPPSPPGPPGPGPSLVFLTQPTSVKAGAFFPSTVRVAVLDGSGNVMTGVNDVIQVEAFTGGYQHAYVNGSPQFVNGVATLTSYAVLSPSRGMRLKAATRFGNLDSQPFDVMLDSGGSLASHPWNLVETLADPPEAPLQVLIDRTNPQALYALLPVATAGGILRSTDGGASWSPANLGLLDTTIYGLSQDPATGALFCVTNSGGIFKSTDSAQSWSWSGDGVVQAVRPSSDGQNVFFGFDQLNSQIAFARGLVRTLDGGAHWTELNSLTFVPNLIAQSSVDDRIVFATDGRTYKSIDTGLTWTEQTVNATGLSLATDPVDVLTAYEGTDRGVYKTTDGGATWATFSSGLPTTAHVTKILVHPTNRLVLYALTSADGAFKTTDGASTWTAFGSGAGGGETVLALDLSQVDGTDLIAGTATGLYRTKDGGMSWTALTGTSRPFGVNRVATAPSNPRIVYASLVNARTRRARFAKSIDAGATWADISNALGASVAVSAIAVHPTDPATVYVSVTTGILKTTDGGASWTTLNAGGPTNSIVIDPVTPSTVFADVTPPLTTNSLVRKSLDSGATWSDATTGLPSSSVGLAIDRTNPSTVYAYNQGLYRTKNGGASWAQIPLPPGSASVVSFAIDPTDGQKLYVGVTDSSVSKNGFLKSTDSGASFQIVQTGYYNLSVQQLAIDPLQPTTIYAGLGAYGGGLLKSTDGGATWSMAREGMWSFGFTDFAFDVTQTGTLYAATQFGLFKTTTGGQ